MFASNLVDFLNGFIFNRDIQLTKDDNKNLGKENCKQGFDFSAKTKQSSKIDCSNNVTSNEKKIELDSNYLSNLRVKNMNRLLIGNLNINSISNKFDQLKLLLRGKVDILVITETKLDSTFPTSQFLIGYSEPYRFDRNSNGGGVLIYVRDDIPSEPLTDHKLPNDIDGGFVELNLRQNKWLLFGSYHPPSQSDESYHPPSQSDEYFFNHLQNGLDIYKKFYDKYMLVGDFNAEDSEPFLSLFLFEMNPKNIVKEPTCFKSLSNPSCIDLVITNSSSNFQNTKAILAGLSDFHKMFISVLKQTFHRSAP